VRHNEGDVGGLRPGAPRHRQERGAALIEAALLIPVLLLIVFAVLELGMMFKSATVTSSSSRAGVRLAAATYAPAPAVGSGTAENPDKRGVGDLVASAVAEVLRDRQSGDTPQQLRIYRAQANGTPVGGDFTACATDCLRYVWNGTSWTYSGGTWSSPDACGATLHSIGVYVSVRHEPSNDFIPLGKTLDEYSVMRLEPRPFNQCTGPGGES
jgi:hypothetical protein